MRKIITISTLLVVGLAVPALASDTDRRCTTDGDSWSVAPTEIRKGLEAVGYHVDHVKDERGCYEVKAVNDSGFPIEAVYDQATGELLWAKLR
jgi:hypothetical protein